MAATAVLSESANRSEVHYLIHPRAQMKPTRRSFAQSFLSTEVAIASTNSMRSGFISILLASLVCGVVRGQSFDGSAWNVSTGNLSVTFIQHSPVGAYPQANYFEPPPAFEALKKLKAHGLVAYEDYIGWGAVEREPGEWDWTRHDRKRDAMRKAGL